MLFKPRKRHDNFSYEELNQLKCDLSAMREDIDEHLQAINDNTNETDIQNSFICEIDNRITKVEEKMDELHYLLKQLVTRTKLSVELSKDEQRVFLVLYTHTKFMKPLDVALKALVECPVAEESLNSIMDKGIPVEREVLDGKVYFRMNKEFKLRQAKEQIIKISTEVMSQYQNVLLNQFFSD